MKASWVLMTEFSFDIVVCGLFFQCRVLCAFGHTQPSFAKCVEAMGQKENNLYYSFSNSVIIFFPLPYPTILSKRMCGTGKGVLHNVKTCARPSSTGEPGRHSCTLQCDKAEKGPCIFLDDTCVFVETDSAVSTFKPQLGGYS